MVTKSHGRTASTLGGNAAILGGLTWLLLVPGAELQRRGLLSYDGYNRLLAIPLLFFLVAMLAAPRALTVASRSVRAGLITSSVGVGLLLAGNIVEFYGVLLQDLPNANAAAGIQWAGSDIGWTTFVFGMLTLLVGGLTAAAGMRKNHLRPTWVPAFIAALGIGVLAANLFALESVLLSVVLALYAAGWIAFGLFVRRCRVSRVPQR
jgi:hypothetical protein